MNRVFHVSGHIVLALSAIAGLSALVMLLWNWLMPDMFGLAAIGFWQALGLLVLVRILFGGMGRHFLRMGMMHHHNPIQEKWMQMTSEERKEFMKKRHSHHCFDQDFFLDEQN